MLMNQLVNVWSTFSWLTIKIIISCIRFELAGIQVSHAVLLIEKTSISYCFEEVVIYFLFLKLCSLLKPPKLWASDN